MIEWRVRGSNEDREKNREKPSRQSAQRFGPRVATATDDLTFDLIEMSPSIYRSSQSYWKMEVSVICYDMDVCTSSHT